MTPNTRILRLPAIIWLVSMMILIAQRSEGQTLTVLSSTYHAGPSLYYACMDAGDCVEIRANDPASATGSTSTHTYRWFGVNNVPLGTNVGNPIQSWCTAFHDIVSCDITDSVGTVFHTGSIEVYVDHTADVSTSSFTGSALLGDSIHLALPTSGTFSDVWTDLHNGDSHYWDTRVNAAGDSVIFNIATTDLAQVSDGFLLNITNVACTTYGGYDIPVYLTVISSNPAGPSPSVCVSDIATMAATGSGTWTAEFNNPMPVITNANAPNTTISGFSNAGDYRFFWTSSAGVDTAYVHVVEAYAGADGIAIVGGSVDMYALNLGRWSAVPGNPGTVNIINPTYAHATMTGFSAPGLYHFLWTSGGICSDTADILVRLAYAGPDRYAPCTIVPGGIVTMGATGAGTWTAMIGNPGTANISNPNNPTTPIANFSALGTYSFIWTTASGTDTALVYVTGRPNAGPDKTANCVILPGGSIVTSATGVGVWTAAAGNPGVATMTVPPNPAQTIVNFTASGTYRFVWTNSSGCSDTMQVTVTGKPNAGPDQTVNCAVIPGGSATMAATGTGTWTAMAGNPCTATITTPFSPNTTITSFTCAGIYTFLWTSGGCTDTVTVTVTARPDAGADQAAIVGGSATMAAIGTGTWTATVGNPTVTTITNPTSPNTTITNFGATGTYMYVWSSSACRDTALVIVTAAGSASAGPDQAVCWGSPATMAATGIGSWTAASANPGAATITSPSSATTTITGFPVSGIYAFIWTTTSTVDTMLVLIDSLSAYSIVHDIPCDSIYGSMDLYITSGTAPFRDSLWYFYGTGGPRGPVSTTITSQTHMHYTDLSGFTRYSVDITDAYGCTFTAWAPDSSRYIICTPDSVWPGDADHNGVADNNDLLAIGVGYGLNGFTRPDQSIVWSAHYAQDWGLHFTSGANAKHADCNGNGVIDANDTTAILLNFGLTHTKTNGYGAPWRSGIPGITLKYSKDTLVAGDTLVTSLILGDSVNTVSNMYGLAFTFHFDPLVVDTNAIAFGFISSFLGNNTNMISIHKDFTNGEVKAAATGINHLNRSGYGTIARFRSIITTDNLNGKDLSYYANISYISDITAIDKDENVISLNAGTDSNSVAYEPTGIRDISGAAHILLSPNPAATQVRVSADAIITGTRITDMVGAEVYSLTAISGRSEMIDISGLSAGIYTVHIVTASGTGAARLTVSR